MELGDKSVGYTSQCVLGEAPQPTVAVVERTLVWLDSAAVASRHSLSELLRKS